MSNWDNDGVPGATDNAIIEAGSGEVHINGDVEVMSVNAGSGLVLDFFNLTIGDGAILEIFSNVGGATDRKFNGLAQVTGGGLLAVLEDMTVAAPVTISLGQGLPETGSGGFRLQSTLTLEANLTNGQLRRMRFQNGTLVGMGGTFINEGSAYTRATGTAVP